MSDVTFKPLDMQRAIRDDGTLTRADKAMLMMAVLRTDNRTRNVRASLERLAEDAGWSRKKAYEVFDGDNEPVMRYFEPVERTRRGVQLRFRPVPQGPKTAHSDGPESPKTGHSEEDVWAKAKSSVQERDTQSPKTGHSVSENGTPSAFSATSANDPSALTGDKEAVDTATPSGPLPEEPPSSSDRAAEETWGLGTRRYLGDRVIPRSDEAPSVNRYRGRQRA